MTPEWSGALGDFFEALRADGDDRWFHPHPLTREHAASLAAYAGADLYYVLHDGASVLAYGLLRGWDEGYAVPSLGIAVRAQARGSGVAAAFMHFLHAAARLRGAERVRLKVYGTNERARRLYERLGYEFAPGDATEIVGVCAL